MQQTPAQRNNVLKYRKKPKFKPMLGAAVVQTATQTQVEPDLQLTLLEAMAVKKFLLFSLGDIRAQLEFLSTDKSLTIKQFKEAKDTAVLIAEYLSGQVQQLADTLATDQDNNK